MGVDVIVGTIIVEGVEYILTKVVDDIGNSIWRAFTDEDGDRVPDDPENPFREWDEEPDNWNPFDPVPVDPVTKSELQIIIVSPDGTMTIYDESGNITAEDCDNAYSLWLSENNFLDKPFDNYSVSEGFLFFIFILVTFGVLKTLFGRRKY